MSTVLACTYTHTHWNIHKSLLCSTLSYARILYKFENKSIPVCFANEVWKDPITQFEDKLPEHSKQDWLKTMEYQHVLSDVMMCKSFHILHQQLKQWFIHDAMPQRFLWEHHCSSVFITFLSVNVSVLEEFEFRWGEVDSHTSDHFSVTEFLDGADSLFPLVLTLPICPSGVAILGEPSWSQGDSEILEPGKEEMVRMMIMNTELWRYNAIQSFVVLFGQ